MQIIFVSVLRANTLYSPSCFLVLNVEIFRVRYRYGFPAAEETRHRGRIQDKPEGRTAAFSVHDDKPLVSLNSIFFGH